MSRKITKAAKDLSISNDGKNESPLKRPKDLRLHAEHHGQTSIKTEGEFDDHQ